MTDSEVQSGIVITLAEEFLARYRKGERPRLKEYIDRHPELAREIREVFPAMAMMEKIAIAEESLAGIANRTAAATSLQQLGDYRIIREVGRGGMGIVYEAEQVSLGRHVALKVLPYKALVDAKHKRRFEREAKLAAKLHHTNIVSVFGVGEQDGLPYYVMQFIQGLGMNEVLDELIRQQGGTSSDSANAQTREASAPDLGQSILSRRRQLDDRTVDERGGNKEREDRSKPDSSSVSSNSSVVLPGQSDVQKTGKPTYWQSIANVGVQVASALDYAHNQGILHRDIKPSNLLLDRHGTVWVTDFGLAKTDDQENLTHTGDVLGTLRYMPPEAFEGKSDRRSDVYALGLTLYELLAMRPAYDEKDRARLMNQVATTEPRRLQLLNPAIPRDLVTIVHKAIERNAGHRYATAAELAADLRRFLDDEPIKARPISTPERLWRWSRRRPAVAAAITFATLLLLAVVALPLVVAINESEHAAELGKQKTKVEDSAAELAKQKTKVEEALKESRRQSAVLMLERALSVCEQGEVARGLLMLAKGLKKAREAEAADLEEAFRWNLGAWSRENHELLHVLDHGANVRAIAFSHDGRLMASGGANFQVRLWDAATGLPHGPPLPHPEPVSALAFHPDGRLLTGCVDGNARMWDVSTGLQIGQTIAHCEPDPNAAVKINWPFQQGISSVAFSPDGRFFATGGWDGHAKHWETASGQLLASSSRYGEGISSVEFHPLGSRILLGSYDWNFRVWEPATAKIIVAKKAGSVICQAAFHPRGAKIATALHQECGVRQWNASNGLNQFVPTGPLLRHYQIANAVAYTPDGVLLLTGSHDRTARFWHAETGRPFGPSLQHRNGVRTVAVSPNNRVAATGASDGTVRLWRIACGPKLHTLPHSGWVRGGPVFDRTSKTVLTSIAGATANKVFRWDLATGKLIGAPFAQGPDNRWITGVALSPDGKTVYTAECQQEVVHFWDSESGQLIRSTPKHGDEIWRMALSPDGRTLLTGSYYYRQAPQGCNARLWSAQTGQPIGPPLQHQGAVFGLAFRPDGKAVLTGSEDRTTRLWDPATGLPLSEPLVHPNAIKAVAYRHDGRAVAMGSADRAAQIWDPATWKPVGPAMQHDGEINCVAYDPKGDLLLTASADLTARLWHVATGKSVGPALRHNQDVTAIACSPDGRIAATISDDHTAGLWAMPVPVTDDPENVWRWAQCATGQTLGDDGAFHVLSPDEVTQLSTAGKKFDHQGPRDRPIPRDLVMFKALFGKSDVKDVAGLMEIARFSGHEKQMYAATAEFLRSQLMSHPDWNAVKAPGSIHSSRRFAASVAAMASAGVGDAANLNADQRAAWNRQAIAWLHAEMKDWKYRLKEATPQTAAEILRLLKDVEFDQWLTPVTNSAYLTKRPLAERDAYRELWATSVQLYETAFATNPKVVEVVQELHRYNAACSAARAGCGLRDEACILSDADRARLRKLSVAWLRADLANWTKLAQSAAPADRALVQKWMKHWQQDADLVGIRAESVLLTLPDEEADACRKLWADVKALLD